MTSNGPKLKHKIQSKNCDFSVKQRSIDCAAGQSEILWVWPTAAAREMRCLHFSENFNERVGNE